MLPGILAGLEGLAGGGVPPIVSAKTFGSGAQTSPFNLALPSPTAQVAGDLLLYFITRAGSGTQTFTWPAGFTQLYSVQVNGGTARAACAYKLLVAGSAEVGATAFQIAVSSSLTTSQSTSYTVYNIKLSTGLVTASAGVDALTANPNPPNHTNAASAPTLWFAAAHVQSGNPSTFPTTYTENQQSASLLGTAALTKNAASDDPGTFTNGSSQNSHARTLLVR